MPLVLTNSCTCLPPRTPPAASAVQPTLWSVHCFSVSYQTCLLPGSDVAVVLPASCVFVDSHLGYVPSVIKYLHRQKLSIVQTD